MLNIDECGDEWSSTGKAGAQKQDIGRFGKTEVEQVGVVSSWYRDGVWALTDAALFLPESGKYRAYMPTLAVDAVALWFAAQPKLKRRSRFADAALVTQQ